LSARESSHHNAPLNPGNDFLKRCITIAKHVGTPVVFGTRQTRPGGTVSAEAEVLEHALFDQGHVFSHVAITAQRACARQLGVLRDQLKIDQRAGNLLTNLVFPRTGS